MMITLSLILPALNPSIDLVRCITSINCALSSKVTFEIILVVPDQKLFSEISLIENLHIYSEETPGIYQAMNYGINQASGRYIYFIGQDDILLPAVAKAIELGMVNNADLILADVFWGCGRIYKNPFSRKSLAWKNWCHQGIIYNRQSFLNGVGNYPVQFRAQADHYVNIVFTSNPRLVITRFEGCIAWYSADGFSTRSFDDVFRQAFPTLVRKYIGFYSFCFVKIRRAILCVWKKCRSPIL